MIRVALPFHLRTLVHIEGEVTLDIGQAATVGSLLDALEAQYPVLKGTIRDQVTHVRRPFIRFYACEKDMSNKALDTSLPEAVIAGREPFLIIGAIAGG
jgi:molybdopterin synthase sulfur carrier subunit